MSMYDDFRDMENATIVVKALATSPTQNPDTLEMEYLETTIFNGLGIFYELSASEKIARQQIQKTATGQIILDPLKVTTAIKETMSVYVTTADVINKKYRMVTSVNPLNKNDAIIIDVVEN